MNVCSVEWVVCVLALSGLFFLLPVLWLRQGLLAACNLAFVATLLPNGAAWIALAAFIGAGYVAAMVLRRWPRRSLLVLYLALVLAAFVVFKQYAFVKWALPAAFLQMAVATVGWSYILFRQIQVAVDAAQGQIETLSLWDYANFQLNVFGFVAGPIQRYEEFRGYWTKLAPLLADTESLLRAYLRLFWGALKVALVSGVFSACYTHYGDLLGFPQFGGHGPFSKRLLEWLAIFYSYPVYIYLNFSGYCDMVIAGGMLFGLKMPENFDRPYLSRNMIEFWTRWHRTLGFWIRDYIFTPMYKAIAGRWASRAASLAFLCYFAAFFLAGVWHGSTWNFVVYGFLNGLGLAVTKLWETHLVKRHGRPALRAYLQNRAIRVAAIVVTVHFAALTMFFFAFDLERAMTILKNVFAPGA